MARSKAIPAAMATRDDWTRMKMQISANYALARRIMIRI
jgi:hypothetical protein